MQAAAEGILMELLKMPPMISVAGPQQRKLLTLPSDPPQKPTDCLLHEMINPTLHLMFHRHAVAFQFSFNIFSVTPCLCPFTLENQGRPGPRLHRGSKIPLLGASL